MSQSVRLVRTGSITYRSDLANGLSQNLQCCGAYSQHLAAAKADSREVLSKMSRFLVHSLFCHFMTKWQSVILIVSRRTTCGSDHEGDSTERQLGGALHRWVLNTLCTTLYLSDSFLFFFCWQDMVLKLGVGWIGIAILPVNW